MNLKLVTYFAGFGSLVGGTSIATTTLSPFNIFQNSEKKDEKINESEDLERYKKEVLKIVRLIDPTLEEKGYELRSVAEWDTFISVILWKHEEKLEVDRKLVVYNKNLIKLDE